MFTIRIETVKCDSIPLAISWIGLGSWAIGSWIWDGSNETEPIKTIQHAVDAGINLIDVDSRNFPAAKHVAAALVRIKPGGNAGVALASEWLRRTPAEIIQAHLGFDKASLKQIPAEKLAVL
jgi:hypothetical protein